MVKFHNPYNFVRTPSRGGVKSQDGGLGDEPPVGQDRYHDARWSGSITVSLTSRTPIVVMDPVPVDEEDGHHTYRAVQTAAAEAILPVTTIKGPLRAAYEAVTNSRMGVFRNDERLTYRTRADDAKFLIPAIVKVDHGNLFLELWLGDQPVHTFDEAPRRSHAVRLPYYEGAARTAIPKNAKDVNPVRLPDGTMPRHNDPVQFHMELVGFQRQVVAISKTGFPPDDRRPVYHGIVSISGENRHEGARGKNANAASKAYERVFWQDKTAALIPVDGVVQQKWHDVIMGYRAGRADGHLGVLPENTRAWSRHLAEWDPPELTVGQHCYVTLKRGTKGRGFAVAAIFPVMISRDVFDASPSECLEPELHPADRIASLSPADRLFGWVRQGRPADDVEDRRPAYRGQVRIRPIEPVAGALVPLGKEGQLLPEQSSPKPSQARFYYSPGVGGGAQMDGGEKREGYCRDDVGRGSLRGRKFYLAHTPSQHYPHMQANERNRSLRDWIRDGAEFTVVLDVLNLSDIELGGLLWLLGCRNPSATLAIGGYKALGFGSATLRVVGEETDLRTTDRVRRGYRDFFEVDPPGDGAPDHEQWADCVRRFQSAVVDAYGPHDANPASASVTAADRSSDLDHQFVSVPFIADYLRAMEGPADQLPVHYPRPTPAEPNEAHPAYGWWSANEKSNLPLGLPLISDDDGLPYRS